MNKRLTLDEAFEAKRTEEHNSNMSNLAGALAYVRQFREDCERALSLADAIEQGINIAAQGMPSYGDVKRLYEQSRKLTVGAPVL